MLAAELTIGHPTMSLVSPSSLCLKKYAGT